MKRPTTTDDPGPGVEAPTAAAGPRPRTSSAVAGGTRAGLAKRLVIGRAMPSSRLEHTLLPKVLALPVFAADALSSVAYCVEASLIVLVSQSGVAAMSAVIPIQIGIAVLMAIVVASYRQTVRAYPNGGGSYIVSKDNLGTLPGLIAAAALLTDYVLTVAVSVVAGVLAIVSIAPATLGPYKVAMSLAFVILIAIANLRGVRESGMLFAFPVYGFIVSMFALVLAGAVRCIGGCPSIGAVPDALPAGTSALGLFVVLYAFSSGSSALTGVEAISNGIRAFRRPQSRNAAQTLLALGVIGITLILGTALLAHGMGARPSASVSVLSEIARTVFVKGSAAGFLFYVVQAFTFAVLILAANTSFQDFPRLSAILARDRFMPRQFENLGDRLVFSNGVIVLTTLACLLIVVFDANVDKLIQLYVVGVFTAFTLSQSGMVRHWFLLGRRGGPEAAGWHRRAVVNGVGAFATGVVTLVVIYTKFRHGAWIVIVAVPVLVALFYSVSRHYRHVARQLREGDLRPRDAANAVVLLVPALDAATARAVGFVRSFKGNDFRAVHVGRADNGPDLAARWRGFSRTTVSLELVEAPRGAASAVIDEVRALVREPGDFVTVVIPECLRHRTLLSALRGRSALSLKLRLLREPGVAVISVPVVDPNGGAADGGENRPLIPKSIETLVFVSAVHDATVRAVDYARSLRTPDVRAVFVALDPGRVRRVWDDWLAREIPVQLDIVEAPFRELNGPVLEEVRRVTSHAGALAVVVIPEFVVPRWRHLPLHNQKALFMKRLLLLEPNVVVASVPFALAPAGGRPQRGTRSADAARHASRMRTRPPVRRIAAE
ncbi:MAG TPA: APC family permease [Actinomycetota bacterium]|jgi:amino acid transporter